MARPQTIQIYLPFSDPRGFRQAEITTRTVRAFEIPRTELANFAAFPEAEQPGIYFLFGQTQDGDPMCYIGESDNVRKRLTDHDAKKDFWTRAVVAVSLTNTWTKAHIRYLENQSIIRAKQAATYSFDNTQDGYATAIPAPLKADCDEFFDTIQVLVSTLGYPVMEIPAASETTAKSERFYLRKAGAEASGTYDAKGMTVFAGSTARIADEAKKYNKTQVAAQKRLLGQGVLQEADGKLRFAKNHTFATPSGASSTIIGAASNGWDDWVNELGARLKDVKRPKADAE
ncbi:hypothetical protein D477_000799 [Arthrobacter crystallopoietes BAB-32]|uniref:DUF4357 domain-containing protein n=1 Tax=Arthrobacter crystallopoietes BAB-32 TaxID=1246476 RepID=N1VCT1_9MICC|nr:GIY-YIG nuclease family protein [Arthrobacter crystallopoietes]EMY36113.1 hypothetical protein D477_000799 [Arthrobacter crystallopoietes BAB-32]